MNTQFMLGDELLVTPILETTIDNTVAYFPPGGWYFITK